MEKHEGGLTDAEKVADVFSTVSDSGRDADLSGRGLVQKSLFGNPVGSEYSIWSCSW